MVVTSDISTIDLYKWSFQIASGMDFLESRKVCINFRQNTINAHEQDNKLLA